MSAPIAPSDPGWPPQLTAWERVTNLPLLVLALLFLAAYAVPILHPELPPWTENAATAASLLVWGLYAVDFAIRLSFAGRGNRFRFVYTHPLDLLMVCFPLVGPLRVVRVAVMFVEVFRRQARSTLSLKAGVYIVGVTGMMLFVSSLAVLDAERGAPGSQIADFGDAFWWSLVTASTVGYGDVVPQTVIGRAVAALLMFAAIGLVGLVSGSLASWFVDRVSAADESAERADLARMHERLASMESQIAELHAALLGDERSDPPAPARQRDGSEGPR